MSATSYETTVVVYVRHLGGGDLPLNADQGVTAVKRVLDGKQVELIPGKLYVGEDAYGTPVALTGFEKLSSAIKREHLVITEWDKIVPEQFVIPVGVTFHYDVPWGVSNVAGKAWDQILAALRGEDTRWGKFLSVDEPVTISDYFGTNGAATFWTNGTETSDHIDSLLDGLRDLDENDSEDDGDTDEDYAFVDLDSDVRITDQGAGMHTSVFDYARDSGSSVVMGHLDPLTGDAHITFSRDAADE